MQQFRQECESGAIVWASRQSPLFRFSLRPRDTVRNDESRPRKTTQGDWGVYGGIVARESRERAREPPPEVDLSLGGVKVSRLSHDARHYSSGLGWDDGGGGGGKGGGRNCSDMHGRVVVL
ncbi:hypothetical protein O988_04612 [Pseudogymnoascus sp. VKM F-3808]|nr:hypothetical protein O988_04612 [Pseudogymnoascus sp. VKM F-3808]KFY44837.1 hypothetical protein V495_03241 [Pseudogymnoascus sp. VKM F-4514 (FW-929)]KFY59166.1 hypothetical protein V497_04494 [Pseudogymnoascus sp. VKM F-4516 (FW-969)]